MRNALFFMLLSACGANASTNTPPQDAAPTDAPPSVDTTPSPDVTAPADVFVDASAPPDASAPADANDPRMPQPPAGARRCGGGALTATDFATTCMAPSSIADRVLLPDGGMGMTERRCGAVSITGGRWEAWCGASEVYVWAIFEGLRATGTYTTCGSIAALNLGIGYGEHAFGGSGGGGTVLPRGVPDHFFDMTRSTNAVMDYTIRMARAGSGRFFLGAQHAVQCVGMTPTGGPGPNVIVGGATFQWDPAMAM